MIRLEGIWKTYTMGGQQLHALQDVCEEIPTGEHVAIMGPSGSGKSTLLNIIGCGSLSIGIGRTPDPQ